MRLLNGNVVRAREINQNQLMQQALPPHLRRRSVGAVEASHRQDDLGKQMSVMLSTTTVESASPPLPDLLPAVGKSSASTTRVDVSLAFIFITDINTVTNTMHCRWWIDPEMIGSKKGDLPAGTWFPDAFIFNASEKDMDRKMQGAALMDSATGLCLNAIEFEGIILIDFNELQGFPFDEHPLMISIHQSEKQDRYQCVFRPKKPEDTACQLYFQPGSGEEFRLRGFTWEAYEKKAGNGVEYSMLNLRFCAARRPWYYLIRIVVPLFLCTIFCFSAMFYDVTDLGDRMSVITTMFLSTSALIFVLSSNLPRTAQLTVIDKYLLATLILQMLVGIESWIVYGAFGNATATYTTLNQVALWVLPLLFLALTVIAFVPATFWYVFITPKSNPRWHQQIGQTSKLESRLYLLEDSKNMFPRDASNALPSLLDD